MICEVCRQKTANVIFKTVTEGQVATRAMCMDCAQNLQQDMHRVFLALGLGIEGQSRPEARQAEAAEKPQATMPSYLCTHCGRPFDALDEQTMAGCAHCYEAMEKELMGVLEAERGSEEAGETEAARTKSDQHTELKYQLLEAVMKEDFEAAALLRDRISALNNAGAAEGQP